MELTLDIISLNDEMMSMNSFAHSECSPADHEPLQGGRFLPPNTLALERAARLFRALGDEARLSLLQRISDREACVTEIASMTGEGVSTISQRLKLLRAEGLVKRRRDGKHLFYSLVDGHIFNLIQNALEHAEEKH